MQIQSITYITLDWEGNEQVVFLNESNNLGRLLISIPDELNENTNEMPVIFNNLKYKEVFEETISNTVIKKIDLNPQTPNTYKNTISNFEIREYYHSFIIIKLPECAMCNESSNINLINKNNIQFNLQNEIISNFKNLTQTIYIPINLLKNDVLNINLDIQFRKVNKEYFLANNHDNYDRKVKYEDALRFMNNIENSVDLDAHKKLFQFITENLKNENLSKVLNEMVKLKMIDEKSVELILAEKTKLEKNGSINLIIEIGNYILKFIKNIPLDKIDLLK